MQCKQVEKRLNAWADNELPAHETAKIERHLKQCPACRSEAVGIQHIIGALEGLPAIQASSVLSKRILRAFRSDLAKQGMVEWWQGLSLALRGAICGVALAGLLCGAVLGTCISTIGPGNTNPYQTLYTGNGILP